MKKLDNEMMNKIAGAMNLEKFTTGTNLITYGDEGKHYFILNKGKV